MQKYNLRKGSKYVCFIVKITENFEHNYYFIRVVIFNIVIVVLLNYPWHLKISYNV